MSKSCSRHFMYDDNCPACRAQSVKEAIEEDRKERERLAEEEREDRERLAEEQRRDHERMLEEERAALEEHAWRVEAAAEKQRRDIARAPQLQAESLVKRAWDLYRVKLYEDALAEARRAMELDRGNIESYRVASWALVGLARRGEAAPYYRKQLALLGMPEHRDSPKSFLEVLTGIPPDDALIHEFSSVLHENSGRWLRHGPPYDLIKFLIDRKLLQDAKRLAQGFVGKQDSLLLHAFVLEIDLALKMASGEGLEAYLRGITFVKRDEVLREFRKISTSNEFSEQTTSVLREAISRRYQEWKPEIEKQICESCTSEAKRTIVGHGWAYGISTFVILAGVVPTFLERVPGNPQEINATTPIGLFGVLFGSILFGVWAGRIHKQSQVRERSQQQIAILEQRERNSWSCFCPNGMLAERASGFPTVLHVLLLFAGFAGYLTLWGSMLVDSLK